MKKRSFKKIMVKAPVLLLICLAFAFQAAAELPELLPLQVFFGGGMLLSPQISPNGQYLSYLAPSKENVINVWIKTIGKNDERMVTQENKYSIPAFYWTYDNKHILYMMDSGGDENFHVYATAVDTGTTRDLARFKDVKAQNIQLSPNKPDEILVGLNVDDKKNFDMYRIHLASGKIEKDTVNPGDVRWWLADDNMVVRAAVAMNPKDISTILRVRDSADKPWRDLITWPFGESGLLEGYGSQIAVSFSKDGKAIYVQAAFSGDQTELALVDATTGKIIETVAADPKASIWNVMDQTLYDMAQVLFHPQTGKVQAVAFEYLLPEWKVYDPAFEKDFEYLKKLANGKMYIESRDLADTKWVVSFHSDVDLGSSYLYDRVTQKAELIFEAAPHLKKYTFAHVEPQIIKARDGMDIPCYLTLPVGIEAKKLPLVVTPHGGPWARDSWGFDPVVQLLANRGYAVLQVNFRGSTGFGKKFLNAGNGQWGVGSMQHDITDAVKHFIAKGIADPAKIAIFGGSYGGYATLAGLAFTPDLYACGIDVCGPANARTNIESMPEWWHLIKQRWLRRMGNVLVDEELNRRISPVFHADKIKAKLLIFHGSNDARVSIAESEQIVNTMRKNNKEVIYVVYPDEGHDLGRIENLIDMLNRTEDFLAKNLGGRAQPFQAVPGSSAQVK